MSAPRMVAALVGGSLLFAGAAAPAAFAAGGATAEAAPPRASVDGGRHIGAQTVTLTAEADAEIRYTLDGTTPTPRSPLYTEPLRIDETSTLTAVAYTDDGRSAPLLEGYFIKADEEPLAQFAVMSDIHLSSDRPDLVAKWETYFDALARIAPEPDAIISNGDQINDNYYNSAADHRFPRAMLEQNLARTGMDDTQVLLSFGNHDDYVQRMAAEYPADWFPQETENGGYYQTEIAGFPAFIVNTERWNSTQASWLYGRLSSLTADPETAGSPIFVFGHRPLPATVWDGAQSSNSGLRSNLADFPQVVYFSGHSHLNINDERSIHQDAFTSVNDGSMSYGETDSVYQSFGNGLVKNATLASAQSVLVEVYDDRVEIDRINYAADEGRTYDENGVWGFQKNPPFASTGTVAGPTWVIARGADGAATKAAFTYTAANRNAVAPVWADAAEPTVRRTDDGLVLRLPQAQDDQYVKSYSLVLNDVTAGEPANFLTARDRINAQYTQMPRPDVLQIPLGLRAGNSVTGPIDRELTLGHVYEATLVAYDSYGNAAEPRSFRFVAGALDRVALDAALAEAEEIAATVRRVLGEELESGTADLGIHIADPAAALAALAELDEAVSQAPTEIPADAPSGPSQDAVDALAVHISALSDGIADYLVAVDRAGLADALAAAGDTVAAVRGKAPWKRALVDAYAHADALRTTLNVSQTRLDAATDDLEAALAHYLAKIDD
ncbi:chitobiase/beta-hexosaminidase C-terminal domain-containing protein [Microbacterium esteraromaticum]|uniref:chitobiase/beta-hexosaminidase C-terminal domain-containing protein n=1 Tax=Microbacterium esteraromaticum TaxID=57043 RepID=UPI003C2D3922